MNMPEPQGDKKKNVMLKVLTVISIFVLLFGVYITGTYIDWKNDQKVCREEFRVFEPNVTIVGAFANEDAWRYNFGKNIKCTVAWTTPCIIGDCKTILEFNSSTLTKDMIEVKKYWEE